MGEGQPGANGRGSACRRRDLSTHGEVMAEHVEGWRAPSVTIEDLERWEDNGAMWRPFEVTATHAVIDLCSCTGEVMERVQSGAEDVIELARARARAHVIRWTS